MGEGEEELAELCKSMERVIDAAQETYKRKHVGLPALFEINQRDNDKKASRPFEAAMKSDSWQRYKQVLLTIMRILYQADVLDDDKKPPFQYTEEQGKK